MPTPKPQEPLSKFLSRCIPVALKERDTTGPKHAAAKCRGIWERANNHLFTNRLVYNRNPLQRDPSRTTTLRNRWRRDTRARINRLKGKILRLIVDEDAFGIKMMHQVAFRSARISGNVTANTRWAALPDPEKVEQFRIWLQGQVSAGLLEIEQNGVRWTDKYVTEAFRKGQARAFDQVRKPELAESLDFFQGTKREFLIQSFGRPVSIEKLELLAGRTFNDLKGVTDAMSQQISRELTDGLIQGFNPRTVARNINKRVDAIGKVRAEKIARTETIRAHAEGQLVAMEQLGVTDVGVAVEWSTAGDDRVCPLCEALNGVVMTIKEATGIIPRHVSCRCAWLPANVGESKRGQVRGRRSIESAIDKSLKREIPKQSRRSVKTQRRVSTWPGAGKTIRKNRPKPVV